MRSDTTGDFAPISASVICFPFKIMASLPMKSFPPSFLTLREPLSVANAHRVRRFAVFCIILLTLHSQRVMFGLDAAGWPFVTVL